MSERPMPGGRRAPVKMRGVRLAAAGAARADAFRVHVLPRRQQIEEAFAGDRGQPVLMDATESGLDRRSCNAGS